MVAVNIESRKVTLFGANKTEKNAEAIISMAIMRRGCDEEFYTTATPGKYKDGDTYAEDSP